MPAGSGARRSTIAGTTTSAIAAMPAVAPSPSVHRSRSFVMTSPRVQLGVTGAGQRQQREDDDQVGEHRAPGRGEEPSPAVEVGVRDPGEAVEQDLDEEDPRERRADVAEQIRVDVVGEVEAVQAEDERREADGDDGERDHQRRRDRDDDIRRVVVGLVVLAAQERREQRDQRRRQHASEQEVVDDVRRLVGDLVAVGEQVLPDHVGEDEHAEQTRYARQRGAGGDDEVRSEQVAHAVRVSSTAWCSASSLITRSSTSRW